MPQHVALCVHVTRCPSMKHCVHVTRWCSCHHSLHGGLYSQTVSQEALVGHFVTAMTTSPSKEDTTHAEEVTKINTKVIRVLCKIKGRRKRKRYPCVTWKRRVKMDRLCPHNAACIPFTCGLSNFGDLGRGPKQARAMGSSIPASHCFYFRP